MARRGARTMRARRLSGQGCAVSRPRRSREAQGILIRGRESEHRGRRLRVFGYFLREQKVTRSAASRAEAVF